MIEFKDGCYALEMDDWTKLSEAIREIDMKEYKVKITQEQADALKALGIEVEECEQPAAKEECPICNEEYWFIADEGDVDKTTWYNDAEDKNHAKIGNVFCAFEEAEFEVEKLKVIAELKKFAEPKDRVWDGYNKHYLIAYGRPPGLKTKNILVHFQNEYRRNDIYFETQEDAVRAIDAVGEDRLKRFYFGIEDSVWKL